MRVVDSALFIKFAKLLKSPIVGSTKQSVSEHGFSGTKAATLFQGNGWTG